MKNIFVGNLDFNTSEEELRQMFEAHGQVDRVSIMTDRDTGRSRGFGFVEMTNAEEGDKAIAALNGTQVGGRTLNVNEARPKVERGGGGGGGGRDRGGRGGGGGGRGRYWSLFSVSRPRLSNPDDLQLAPGIFPPEIRLENCDPDAKLAHNTSRITEHEIR